ncbi:MAG: phage major capsid protein [Planctomycetota bacterium]
MHTITTEDLGVEIYFRVKASTPTEWRRKAIDLIDPQGNGLDGSIVIDPDSQEPVQVVDTEGNPVGAKLVINAITPTQEELDEDGAEDDDPQQKGYIPDEPGIYNEDGTKYVVEQARKQLEADARRETRNPFTHKRNTPNGAGRADHRKDFPMQYVTRKQKSNLEGKGVFGGVFTGGDFRNDDKKQHGFKNFGEYAACVAKAASPGGEIDNRLHTKAPTTFGTGSVGSDGGFAIPPDYIDEIVRTVAAEQSIMSMTDQMPLTGRSLSVPHDDVSPWDSSNGIQAYWDGEEGSQATQTKPKINSREYKLSGITALGPVTEDLYEDSAALAAWLPGKAAEKLQFKVDESIIRGTGAGQPLGVLNADALIAVAKEGSQTADTITTVNILNMWSRMYSQYRTDAVWFVSPSAEPQLGALSLSVGTAGGQLVYMPVGGLSGAPYSTLMGRPVLATEHCETLGDQGDIILGSMAQYRLATKASGLQVAESMHLYFDYNMMAYKFRMRVHGAPKLSAPIPPRTGSHTLSSVVTLAARA